MRTPTLLNDLKEVKDNWHDPRFRRGFWIGLRPYLIALPIYIFGGLVVGFMIARLLA